MVSQVASPRREYIQNRLTVSVGDGIGEDSVLQQCLHVPFGCTLCIIVSLVLLTKIDISNIPVFHVQKIQPAAFS